MKTIPETIASALSCSRSYCQCGRQPTDGKHLTHCPAHDDEHPSLSVSAGKDGKVLVRCFAGCSQEAVVSALKERGLWPENKRGLFHPSVKGATPQHPPTNGSNEAQNEPSEVLHTPGNSPATPPTGLTLESLAKAKNLPLEFLHGLGIRDFKYKREPAVRIPYSDVEGNEAAVRFRVSLEGGKRFVWRRGDRLLLYGLEQLSEAKQAGWVLLVEGESDCWTSWYYGLPALGIPGKSTWKSEWSGYLDGLEVYLWEEPDASDLAERVAGDIPSLRIVRPPDGVKDISNAHLNGEDVPSLLEVLKTEAIPAATIMKERSDARIADLRNRARSVLEADDPLDLIRHAFVVLGYGGDFRPAMICYLAATSRLLKMRPGGMPVHLLLVGPSSTGKSWTWDVVRRLLPQEAYHQIDAGSARILIYDKEPLEHRVLAFGEADSLPASEDNPAASAVRNLLQDHYLHYQATVRSKETGEFTVKDVLKRGPTVLITTSTRALGEQLGTRLFTLEIPYDWQQIWAALQSQVQLEKTGSPTSDDALIAFQGLLQALAPWDVIVPFVGSLAEVIGKSESAPRILRDFARLLSLIKSVAVLRYRQREIDGKGRLVAQLEDYGIIKGLVGEMYETTVTGASANTRAIVEAVKELVAAKASSEDRVSVSDVARHLRIHKGGASRGVRTAIKNGWLENKESRKGRRADLIVGEPLPDSRGLPEVSELCGVVGVATGGATPFQLQNEGGVAVLQGSPQDQATPPIAQEAGWEELL